MSNIPICRLCECVPSESFDLIDIETMYYNCDTSGCPVAESGMMLTPEQWQQLMGGGEPVAWRPKLAHPIPYVTGAPRESDLKHWEGSMGVEIEYAYAGQPSQASAVDDAVLRDAARYRWLRGNGHLGEWDSVGLSHLSWDQRIDTDIDTAMKGEG